MIALAPGAVQSDGSTAQCSDGIPNSVQIETIGLVQLPPGCRKYSIRAVGTAARMGIAGAAQVGLDAVRRPLAEVLVVVPGVVAEGVPVGHDRLDEGA